MNEKLLKKYNENLQYKWSHANSKGVRFGAINRVDEVFEVRNKMEWKFPMDTVLNIGSQWGHEANRYREQGVKKVVCVDVVKDFIIECKKRGFESIYSAMEEIEPIETDGVHASHVLEHCYDIEKVINIIKSSAKYWCYVSVPIEPDKSKDEAHLSQIKNKDEIIKMFKPWVCTITQDDYDAFSGIFFNNETYKTNDSKK